MKRTGRGMSIIDRINREKERVEGNGWEKSITLCKKKNVFFQCT